MTTVKQVRQKLLEVDFLDVNVSVFWEKVSELERTIIKEVAEAGGIADLESELGPESERLFKELCDFMKNHD